MKKLTLTIWLLLFLGISLSVKGALIDNLYAYYPLDGDGDDNHTGTWDGNLSGTVYHNKTFYKHNSSITFRGSINNDFYDLGANFLNGYESGDFTINGWISTALLTHGTNTDMAIGISDERGLLGICVNSKVACSNQDQYFSINIHDGTAWQYACDTSLNIIKDTFYMVTAVVNSSHAILYVNGTQKATTPYDGALDRDDNSANSIGAFRNHASWFTLKGQIDEVGFWTRALSDSEIEELYNNGTGLYYPFSTSYNVNWDGYTPYNDTRTMNNIFYFNHTADSNKQCILYRLSLGDGGGNISCAEDVNAYFRFEEGTGQITYDSSCNRHNGTLYNGSSFSGSKGGNATGNYSLDFDGTNDIIEIPDHDNFSFHLNETWDKPFTIMFWMNLTNAVNAKIMSKFNGPGNDEWYIRTELEGGINFRLYSDGNASNFIGRKTSGTISGYNGEWRHHAFTYSGSQTAAGFTIYGNGGVQSSTADNAGTYSQANNTNANINIGGSIYYNLYEEVQIDELLIFNRVLSQSEIQDIYNNGYDLNGTAQNGTISQWINVSTKPSVAPNFKDNFTYTSMSEGTNTLRIGCEGTNSTDKIIVYDITAPNPLISGFINDTTYTNTTVLNLNYTFNDETGDLYNVNVTITRDSTLAHSFYINGSLGSTYSYYHPFSLNMTGNYTSYYKSCDSASEDLFKSKRKPKITKSNNFIAFDSITVANYEALDMDYKREQFGYGFESTYSKKTKEETYIINSDCPLYHLINSRYSSHLISPNCGMSIEFEKETTTTTRLSMNTFEVKVFRKSEGNKFEINSVHWLNCVNGTHYWYSTYQDDEVPPNMTNLIPTNNTHFSTTAENYDIDFSFNINEISNCSFFFNGTLNNTYNLINGSVDIGTLNLPSNKSYYWSLTCNDTFNNQAQSGNYFFTIVLRETEYTCPDTIPNALIFFIIIGIAMALIITGFVKHLGIAGFLGSLILLVSSWYIGNCFRLPGSFIMIISIILMVYFAIVTPLHRLNS
jgi:hypothetical protein